MKKATGIIFLLTLCLILISCGEETGVDTASEIERYKAQVASLEEDVIKLNEEITVKDDLIKELRDDERAVREQESRRRVAESYYAELERALDFTGGYQAYTQQGPLNGNYSVDRGLQTMEKIRIALDSFADLTVMVREQNLLAEDVLEAMDYTDEATQRVELYNMSIRVEGQLMELNYITKALDLRRALVLYELGRIERKDLNVKNDAFLNAREKYQEFINNTFYLDETFYTQPFNY